MHWNLPSNPIDLEQREGRINRYKCLAVRQNIARLYSTETSWEAMFERAAKELKGQYPDLVPYWCLPNMDGSMIKIERIVPMYPYILPAAFSFICLLSRKEAARIMAKNNTKKEVKTNQISPA